MVLQVASAIGCHAFIAMPDDAAIEKAQLLQALGEHRVLASWVKCTEVDPSAAKPSARVTVRLMHCWFWIATVTCCHDARGSAQCSTLALTSLQSCE